MGAGNYKLVGHGWCINNGLKDAWDTVDHRIGLKEAWNTDVKVYKTTILNPESGKKEVAVAAKTCEKQCYYDKDCIGYMTEGTGKCQLLPGTKLGSIATSITGTDGGKKTWCWRKKKKLPWKEEKKLTEKADKAAALWWQKRLKQHPVVVETSGDYSYSLVGLGWCINEHNLNNGGSSSGKEKQRIGLKGIWKKAKTYKKEKADAAKFCEDRCTKDASCIGYVTEDHTKCQLLPGNWPKSHGPAKTITGTDSYFSGTAGGSSPPVVFGTTLDHFDLHVSAR